MIKHLKMHRKIKNMVDYEQLKFRRNYWSRESYLYLLRCEKEAGGLGEGAKD
jgi:hypothetical protein